MENFIIKATTEAESMFQHDELLLEYEPIKPGNIIVFNGINIDDALSTHSLFGKGKVITKQIAAKCVSLIMFQHVFQSVLTIFW